MTTKSEKFSFDNGHGAALAGIIDMPETGTPAFYGVFAPCFTCVKETHGALKISRALAARGGAILRFDTTGVGQSQGTLAHTNFTTRVEDIIAACRALTRTYQAPRLLIGHSISGPAAISAARQIPSLDVVATVCSPQGPQTMLEKFAQFNQMALTDTQVELDVLGRKTVFNRSFIDDLQAQDLEKDTREFDKTLLVFHAPHDNIVDFSNMQAIYDRATHARHREMLPMDENSTHLFETRNGDENFVAENLLKFL